MFPNILQLPHQHYSLHSWIVCLDWQSTDRFGCGVKTLAAQVVQSDVGGIDCIGVSMTYKRRNSIPYWGTRPGVSSQYIEARQCNDGSPYSETVCCCVRDVGVAQPHVFTLSPLWQTSFTSAPQWQVFRILLSPMPDVTRIFGKTLIPKSRRMQTVLLNGQVLYEMKSFKASHSSVWELRAASCVRGR